MNFEGALPRLSGPLIHLHAGASGVRSVSINEDVHISSTPNSKPVWFCAWKFLLLFFFYLQGSLEITLYRKNNSSLNPWLKMALLSGYQHYSGIIWFRYNHYSTTNCLETEEPLQTRAHIPQDHDRDRMDKPHQVNAAITFGTSSSVMLKSLLSICGA